MSIYVGIALVVVGLAIFIFAVFRGRRRASIEESLLSADEAIKMAFEAIDDIPDSDTFAGMLLAQDDVEVRLVKLFDALFSAGKTAAAQKVADIIIKYVPDMAAGYTRSGMAAMKKQNREKALEAFETAIKIEPENIHTANNLGYLYNNMKRYEDAINVLESAFSEENGNSITFVNLGIAYFHIGNTQRAYELLNGAYKINPKIPEIHLYIGHCLRELGEVEKAAVAYKRYRIIIGEMKVQNETPNENKIVAKFDEAERESDMETMELQPDKSLQSDEQTENNDNEENPQQK